ncbi:TetR/AcrR family transcriptional regulator [Streptomyces sp. S.PB5]|uniref:TetR/AcrR family transcriptional regulator n=1 Tax=Streptomyces sp. S.PB5 TaxID=3020844 RepID=UPI0025B0F732|nr:TetR/AcrR family transcriptional regulator [Streptomyces sp. S.PB5]MDN3026004.1 TetR/AcrR family transcriptional regulator [Streptomyces sp. S.PB5]
MAAERLFAERRLVAVSHGRPDEATAQGAIGSAGYHFGTKADLVRAIVRSHGERIDRIRVRILAETGDSADLHDWVSCLVRPVTEHLAVLGSPSWYARFSAQVMTDPALRDIAEFAPSPALKQILDGLRRCRTGLPAEVHAERAAMARQLIVHVCAEREGVLALNTMRPRPCWRDTATSLTDAIVGLWLAPVTNRSGGTA